ncbi:hypothetical protein AtubIFM54640_010753 [Aspergillus tubingensis]|nr:hypothetical protein AtubIFM54640_010753 [Aspergillus tubingensis]
MTKHEYVLKLRSFIQKNDLNEDILNPGQPASAEEQPGDKDEDPASNEDKDPEGDKDEEATGKQDKQPAGDKDEAAGDRDKDPVSDEDEDATGASVADEVNRSAKEIWKEHGLEYATGVIGETETTIIYEEQTRRTL